MGKPSRRARADLIDLEDKRFGAWTVIRLGPPRGTHTRWWARCKCGRQELRRSDALRRKGGQFCVDCDAKAMIGRRFSSLVVIGKRPRDKFNKSRWACRCDCGRLVVVGRALLRLGSKRACRHSCETIRPSPGAYFVIERVRRPSGTTYQALPVSLRAHHDSFDGRVDSEEQPRLQLDHRCLQVSSRKDVDVVRAEPRDGVSASVVAVPLLRSSSIPSVPVRRRERPSASLVHGHRSQEQFAWV
jgi:hypothetical protein